jgi:hypothetical protein
MKLSEINKKCIQLVSDKDKLKLEEVGLQNLEAEEIKARENFEIQKELAEIKGENYEDSFKDEQLAKTKIRVEELRSSLMKQENEILEGLKQLVLDVLPNDFSEPDPEKKVVISFGNASVENATNWIASLISSPVPLRVDNVSLHPDKIVATGVEKKKDVVEALKTFLKNMRCVARVMLKEADPEVENTAKYFYECNYRDIWEAINGRRSFSYQDLYLDLKIGKNNNEMKRVRNFFTNAKILLKDRYVFTCLDKGSYELNFFGQLVWKAYQNDYLGKTEAEKTIQKQEVSAEKTIEHEERLNKEKTTLNDFLDNKKIHETIYGKGVE